MPARACRACLATDIKLYNIYKNNLYEAYGEVVGNPIFESDDLPQHICAICYALLRKYTNFRERVRLSQDLLEEFELKGIKTTTKFIKTIDRKKCGLALNLGKFTPLISNLDLEEEIPEPPPQQPPEKPPEQSDNVGLQQEPDPWCPDTLEPWSPESIRPWSPNDSPKRPGTPPANVNQSSTEEQDNTKTKARSRNNLKIKTMFDFPKKVDDFQEYFNVDVLGMSRKGQFEEFREKQKKLFKLSETYDVTYCVTCGKRCSNAQHLEKHQTEMHDASLPFECEICSSRFDAEIKLSRHILVQHIYKIRCRLCGFVSYSSTKARCHALEHGLAPKRTTLCEHCGASFEDRASLNTHMRENHMDKLLWCKLCGETKMFDKGMAAHMSWHMKVVEFKYECSKCETLFITKEALDKHLSLTCEGFSCVVCGINVDTKTSLRKHVVQEHSKYQGLSLELCSGCGVKFFGADALANHQIGGSCGEGLPCQECGVSCPDISAMTMHKADYHRILIRACEECDRAFDPDNYRQHMLAIHNIKAEVFRPVLPRAMTRVWSVHGNIICSTEAKPISAPNGPRPFMCDVCAKSFKTRTTLKYHIIRTHTNERPFKCDICHKGFPWKSLYKKHMQNHTTDKPYSCKFCPKTFRNRTPLCNHLKTHMNLRPHICHVCGKRFRTSTCIKTHIRAVHLHLPTRGPKKWARDEALRELQGKDELFSNVQEQAGSREHVDEFQSRMDESQSYMDGSQSQLDESQNHIEEFQSHIEESEVPIDEFQAHINDETHTDRDLNRHFIAPEGFIDSESGFRIYPIKEKKRKPFQPESERVVKRRRRKTNENVVERRQRNLEPTVEKVTCRLDLAPGKVQFRPVTENFTTNIKSNTGEHSVEKPFKPRIIKTIRIKKNKKRIDNQNYAQRTQYIHEQTHSTDTQVTNTHSQNDIDNHTQYVDDSNVDVVYNTLSRHSANTPHVSKTKSVKKVRTKGKSMPSLDLDNSFTAIDLNTAEDQQDSFDIQDHVNIKKTVSVGSTHSINIPQNYMKSKEVILDTKDIGAGKGKYMIVASTSKKRNVSNISTSGKTGWK